jgi:transcriptional regulator with XRE-family HTH domain
MARTARRLTPATRLGLARAVEAVARNVRTLRAGRFSQEELAYRAGLDRTLVSGIERGRHNVTLVTLVALARTLEVPPERLLEARRDIGGEKAKGLR